MAETTAGDALLNVAEDHFKQKLAAPMYRVDVPEWQIDDRPVSMYFKPPTLAERDAIFQCIRKGTLESIAQTLVTRARDESGRLMFRQVHVYQLMNRVDPAILDRVLDQLAAQEGVASVLENALAEEAAKK